MEDTYIIPLNGLDGGAGEFRWRVGKEFFAGFGNSEIRDADIEAVASVRRSAGRTDVDCGIGGTVVTVCDRCLGDLPIRVDEQVRLRVRFGVEASEAEEYEEDGRELVFVSADDAGLDIGQVIYDYVCLAIPLHKVHEDGGCDPEVLKYLATDGEASAEGGESDSPFASLKGLFETE